MDDASSNMVRLAIGVFYATNALASAIAELRADGVGAAEMCLAGTPAVIDAYARSDHAAAPLGKPAALPAQLAGLELVATDGQLLRVLLDHSHAEEGTAAPAHSWLLPDLFAGLAEHLRARAIALFVSASDFGLQRRASRILLRHTAHAVQTHEFTARRSGSLPPSGEKPRA